MHDTVLNETIQRNIQILSQAPFIKSFYLAGGTGCALHLGHRISLDLDFFSKAEFSPLDIQRILKKKGDFITDYSDKETLTGRFNTSKISLFHYDYPLMRRHHIYKKIKVASLEDIGCMKIEAISARGKKRDFTDLYFILKKKKMTLEDLIKLFKHKYQRTKYNLFHILKSLVYFEDADMDPDLMTMTDISWYDIKNFFVAQMKEFKISHT